MIASCGTCHKQVTQRLRGSQACQSPTCCIFHPWDLRAGPHWERQWPLGDWLLVSHSFSSRSPLALSSSMPPVRLPTEGKEVGLPGWASSQSPQN